MEEVTMRIDDLRWNARSGRKGIAATVIWGRQ